MQKPVWTAAIAAAVVGVSGGAAAAGAEDLEQRILILERKLEIQAEEAQAKAKDAAGVTSGDKGFSLKSADGAYELRIRALAQFDGRFFLQDDRLPSATGNGSTFTPVNDGFLIRRLRPTFEGSAGKLVGFRLTPEFAGDGTGLSASIVDAHVDLKFHPAASVRVGKQKGPVGLERLQSGGAIGFVERGLPTELVPNRDIGVALFGEAAQGTVQYTVGVFNGTPDGRDVAAPDADSRETAGRVFLEPFRNEPGLFQGLGFGIAGTYGTKRSAFSNTGLPTVADATGITNAANSAAANAALPRYRSPGQNQFFSYRVAGTGLADASNTVVADGEHLRWSPQAYWYHDRFGLLGEYVLSDQEVSVAGTNRAFQHRAHQLAGSIVLTGEDASFRGVKPAVPFTAGGEGWGALEFVARHGELDIDDGVFEGTATTRYADPHRSASRARSYGAGLNWHLTQNARLVLDYDETRFLGGAGASAATVTDRPREQVIFTRLQLQY